MADEQPISGTMEKFEHNVSTAPSILTPSPAPVKHATATGPTWKDKLALKWTALKDFYRECVRVLKVTKKPDRQEFTTVVKISGLGILAIGLIGFLIHLAKELLL